MAEEEAEEDEDDVVAVAGNVAEAALPGPGSSSARSLPGLYEGQVSFVEFTPDPRIIQYILSSRKRRSETATKQTLPKRWRSTHQSAPTGNVLVGELMLSLYRVVFLVLL